MMTTTGADAAVAAYLERLEVALRELPGERRAEIVGDISDHIAGARAELPGGGDEAAVRNLLDRLGTPEQIAASAGVPEQAPARRSTIVLEVAALILLNLGGLIVPVVGWFVGVALLWASPRWTRGDKLIGTFVPPGGLAGILLVVFTGAPAAALYSAPSCQATPVPAASTGPVPCSAPGTPLWQDVLLWLVIAVLIVLPFVTTWYLARRLRGRR